jgi:hypothetical protein
LQTARNAFSVSFETFISGYYLLGFKALKKAGEVLLRLGQHQGLLDLRHFLYKSACRLPYSSITAGEVSLPLGQHQA